MFAVPGWKISADLLKTQTAPIDAESKGQKSKKRKRAKKERLNEASDTVDVVSQQPPVDTADTRESLNTKVPSNAKRQKTQGEGTKDTRPAPTAKNQSNDKLATSHEPVVGQSVESKKEKRKDKKKNASQDTRPVAQADMRQATKAAQVAVKTPAVPPVPAAAKLTPMQSAMRQKLVSARFRHLNQTLYTAPSATSLELFAGNPEMFNDYHAGFRQQVSVWPENPVDTFISILRQRASVKISMNPFKEQRRKNKKQKPNATGDDAAAPEPQPASDSGARSLALPRTKGACTIADLGCGDARLASTLTASKETRNNNLKILSYDLQSPGSFVTKCDIANLPLKESTVDIAIFCLALMGTNWIDFVEEAYRVLRWKGELWVAEIKSRFGRVEKGRKVVAHSVGSKRKEKMGKKERDEKKRKAEEEEEDEVLRTEVDDADAGVKDAETDVTGFVEVLERRGFVLKDGSKSVDLSNKMFVKMEFVKGAPASVGKNVRKDERSEGQGQKRFLDEEKAPPQISAADEAKVLKPCLYKIR